MKDKTCKNQTCDYTNDNIDDCHNHHENSNKECCNDMKDCDSSKKCCIDMDKIVTENSELKKNISELEKSVEDLSKQNQDYKQNLYKYSAHITQIQAMLNEIPKNQKKDQIKFCSSVADIFANAYLLKKSDQYNIISEEMKGIFEFFVSSIEKVLNQYGCKVHYPEVGVLCNYDYCAVESIEESEQNNIVIKVISPAFLMDNDCIRRAQVVVSKKK